MPSQKSTQKKRKTPAKAKSAGRPIWKGTINFGLVNIPVALYSAEADGSLDFDLLDRRDFSRVRYRRVNEKTGREVPWDEIVKGYEYKKGQYVALTDDDFLKANVEATQSIDILDFVDAADISPIYFDKPYYLVPLKNGQRAYALLREVMKRTGKVGIARVVIRSRQHLAALLQMIDKKIKSGQTKAIEPVEAVRKPKPQGKVVDIMHLLRQSMDQANKKQEPSRSRK